MASQTFKNELTYAKKDRGRITRLAESDAADNYTGVVALYSMDCHVQRRAAGSVTEIPA